MFGHREIIVFLFADLLCVFPFFLSTSPCEKEKKKLQTTRRQRAENRFFFLRDQTTAGERRGSRQDSSQTLPMDKLFKKAL